jgi:hypothetical protein
MLAASRFPPNESASWNAVLHVLMGVFLVLLLYPLILRWLRKRIIYRARVEFEQFRFREKDGLVYFHDGVAWRGIPKLDAMQVRKLAGALGSELHVLLPGDPIASER